MKANVNASKDSTENQEKALDDFFRNANMELGKIKAEAASAQAEMNTAKRALDESTSEMNKLQRYAEKAVEAANDDGAHKFLERKSLQAAKQRQLQANYERAVSKVASLQQIQDKLAADLDRLEARRLDLRGKLADAKLQQQLNTPDSSIHDAFKAVEEEANRILDEAAARAELLHDGQAMDLDEKFKALELEKMKKKE